MALEVSSKSKHRHVRTLTPVIPVLPLSANDKKWRKLSPNQSSPKQDESQKIASSSERLDVIPNEATSQQPSAAISESTHAKETKDVLSEVEIKHDQEIISQNTEQPLPAVIKEDVTTAELKSQGNNEVNEEIPVDMEASNEPQAMNVESDESPTTMSQLPDEESSEDLSSAVQSSTTAPTDYGQSLAESALHTTLDDSPPRSKNSSQYRKSGTAPEVNLHDLQNRDQHQSREINGSISTRPVLAEPTPLLPIHEYLNFLSSNKETTDVILQVNQASKAYQPSLHAAHSLFLMRSDRLSKAKSDYDQNLQSKIINLHPARNILPHAFEAAVRFFYADYVLTSQSLFPQTTFIEPQIRAQGFEYILSYWISGVELGLSPVKTRAFELMKEILDVSMVEIVAKESRDLRSAIGGLSTKSIQDDVKEIADILSRFLGQMISSRIKSGDFDLTAGFAGNILSPRFMELDSRSALSGVVFGSLPTQSSPPSLDSIITYVLLQVDFESLVIIATELMAFHGKVGEGIIRQVIGQREQAREDVVSNKGVSNKQRLNNSSQWQLAGLRESIDQLGQLRQERVGFILPSKNR